MIAMAPKGKGAKGGKSNAQVQNAVAERRLRPIYGEPLFPFFEVIFVSEVSLCIHKPGFFRFSRQRKQQIGLGRGQQSAEKAVRFHMCQNPQSFSSHPFEPRRRGLAHIGSNR